MKVNCPQCSSQVPATNINLSTGWAKCDECHELFQLQDVASDFAKSISPAPKASPPFNARAIVERTAQELRVHVPAEGWRAATISLLGFAIIWLGFEVFWTGGVLGWFGDKKAAPRDWTFAVFSIPFWLAGFGMLAGVAWKLWATRSVSISRDGMTMKLRCLIVSWSKWIETNQVQIAKKYEQKVESTGMSPYGVEVVFRNGSIVLPVDSQSEERWLIDEINDFLAKINT